MYGEVVSIHGAYPSNGSRSRILTISESQQVHGRSLRSMTEFSRCCKAGASIMFEMEKHFTFGSTCLVDIMICMMAFFVPIINL